MLDTVIKKRIRDMINKLNEASRAYYQEDREIMSNFEYDELYDSLFALEQETGITMSDSPTVNVGYEALDCLEKCNHKYPMLSLDKTKNPEELVNWIGHHEGVLSWKLDGLTVVLTYEGGELVEAVTRGNGQVGEVVTHNAKMFKNVPLKISYEGTLVIRGEACIKYSDFEKINAKIADINGRYKNPRNLCSGSVRQLDNKIAKARNINFYAFTLVQGIDGLKTKYEQLNWLKSQGFDVVGATVVESANIISKMNGFADAVSQNDIPSDGLVLTFNDIEYSNSLGTTSKFPRDSIAFKWKDETQETTLREVEWSASRTGLINPVAVFDPVELEGTTVSRASVHNIGIIEDLQLGIGDEIEIYKANKIIPQIAENLTCSGNLEIPSKCPVCGGETEIVSEYDTKVLYCKNPECAAKKIKSLAHFVSRDALNIDGLSEATLEKFINAGIIYSFVDIFNLNNHEEIIIHMDGFGERSYERLIEAINTSRNTTPARLLYGLGIPNIGLSNAKLIAKHCHNKWGTMQNISYDDLIKIDGIGEVMARSYVEYFNDDINKIRICRLLDKLDFDESFEDVGDALSGKAFVITGNLIHYENRNDLKAEIEKAGGKVAGSVSKKTDYLINNDVASSSSKNKKAKELNIPIITEEEFIEMLDAADEAAR